MEETVVIPRGIQLPKEEKIWHKIKNICVVFSEDTIKKINMLVKKGYYRNYVLVLDDAIHILEKQIKNMKKNGMSAAKIKKALKLYGMPTHGKKKCFTLSLHVVSHANIYVAIRNLIKETNIFESEESVVYAAIMLLLSEYSNILGD